MEISVAAQIAEQLAWTCTPCARHPMSADQVREYAPGYLGYLDEELLQFPDVKHIPHSNLWMHDGDSENAIVVAILFRQDEIEVVCGVGDAHDIKRFAENEEPEDVEQVPSEFLKRLRVAAGPIRFSRAEAEEWLGRSW